MRNLQSTFTVCWGKGVGKNHHNAVAAAKLQRQWKIVQKQIDTKRSKIIVQINAKLVLIAETIIFWGTQGNGFKRVP